MSYQGILCLLIHDCVPIATHGTGNRHVKQILLSHNHTVFIHLENKWFLTFPRTIGKRHERQSVQSITFVSAVKKNATCRWKTKRSNWIGQSLQYGDISFHLLVC